MKLEVEPLTPHIGAAVRGIDLSTPPSDAQLAELRDVWLQWMVLVFPEQDLTRDQHKALGGRLGALHQHPMNHVYSGDPDILVVKTDDKSKYTAGNGWHTDVSCEANPPMASMLYMKETPEAGCGGDTLFANMYRAYEMLSAPMQEFLQGCAAIHDGARPYLGRYGVAAPEGQEYPRNEHPVICRHPETGKHVLYVNAGFTTHIRGLRTRESEHILRMLTNLIETTPELTCRVTWKPGTLVWWDNRCTQHHSVWDYFPQSRYAERVSIVAGQPPSA